MAGFSIQNETSFGVSDILIVRPDQVITDSDLSRFNTITIKDDSKTGARGTLVVNDGGVATGFKSDDLIVLKDTTIDNNDSYNNILITPDNTLTVV